MIEITANAVNKGLASLLAINHLIFPLQMWMGNTFEYLEANGSTHAVLPADVSVVIVYTIASSVTNEPLWRAICLKICLISIISASAVTSYTGMRWPLVGFLVEATLAGTLDAIIFELNLSVSFHSPTRQIQRIKLLFITLAGYVLIPRTLDMLGIPTHLSLNIKPDIELHGVAVLHHALIKEVLIFSLPSIFARLSSIMVPGFGRVISKQPIRASNATTTAPDTPHKITALHQFILWFLLRVIIWKPLYNIVYTILNPLSPDSLLGESLRAVESVEQGKRWLRQQVRLILLGRVPQRPPLSNDPVALIQAFCDIYLYISLWVAGFSILYLLLHWFWDRFVRR